MKKKSHFSGDAEYVSKSHGPEVAGCGGSVWFHG